MRLTHIAKYVEWMAIILLEGNVDRKTALDIAKMKKGFESRRPSAKRRNQVGRGKGLTPEQELALMGVVRPGSDRNPFDDEGVQVRNELMFLLLCHLGVRSGELLNIRVDDIDWSKNQIVIARRADEKKELRRRQPLVKTLDRRLPLKDTLVRAIHNYVIHYRRKVSGSRKCEYLLVTHKSGPTRGQAMSRSTLIKVINMVAGADPAFAAQHAHELRQHMRLLP
jgi:integrase